MSYVGRHTSWSRAYVVVASLWLLLVPGLTFFADVLLQGVFNNLAMVELRTSYPLLKTRDRR